MTIPSPLLQSLAVVAAQLPFHLNDTEQVNAAFRRWREQEFAAGLQPPRYRLGLALWAWLALRPGSYRLASALVILLLRLLGARRGRLARLPFAHGWTAGRDMPVPEGGSFHAQWRRRRGA